MCQYLAEIDGDAKVANLERPVLGQEYVVGLDVQMNQVVAVDVRKTLRQSVHAAVCMDGSKRPAANLREKQQNFTAEAHAEACNVD
jgi:hypothetical protein